MTQLRYAKKLNSNRFSNFDKHVMNDLGRHRSLAEALAAAIVVSLQPEHADLLEKQDQYVRMVLDGQPDQAFHTFGCTNRANVGVALFMLGCIRDDWWLQQKAYVLLEQVCIAIGCSKGLEEYRTDDGNIWNEALDSFLMEFRRLFSTPLHTAMLLLKNLLPNGHAANFGLIVSQRLAKACHFLERCFREKDDQVLRLDDAEKEREGDGEAERHEHFCDYDIFQILISRQLTDRLLEGLTQRERVLWKAAADRTEFQGVTWDAIAADFADSVTGHRPTANAVRKEWTRLCARLRNKFQELTGEAADGRFFECGG